MAADQPQKRNPLAQVKPEPPASYVEDLTGQGEQPRKLRARRKDATGQKSDYHQGTIMVGVRLPDEVGEWVKARAEREGLSVNAWLKNLIMAVYQEQSG